MPAGLRVGVAYMLASQVMFTLMAACVRGVNSLPFMEIVALRSVSGMILFGGYIAIRRQSFLGQHRGDLLWRGCSGFVALLAHYYALTHIPLATATLLANTAPILVAVLAAVFLHEPLKPRGAALLALSLLGVYWLVSPDFHSSSLGYAAGICAAFFIAFSFFFIRKLKQESPFTIAFYFVTVSSLGSVPFALQDWVWPDETQWLLLAGLAISAFFAQLWLTQAFQHGKAAVISAMAYSGPVFAWVLGYLWFDEALTLMAQVGAGLIILSGVLIVYLESRTKP